MLTLSIKSWKQTNQQTTTTKNGIEMNISAVEFK